MISHALPRGPHSPLPLSFRRRPRPGTCTPSAWSLANVQTGKVFAEGTSCRIELDPRDSELPLYPVAVSTDGGEHETAIDPARRFYYSLKQDTKPTSSLFSLFPMRPLSQSLTGIQVVVEEPAPEPISGLKTREYEIRLSYDTKVQFSKNEIVPGKVSVRAR